MRTWPEIPVLLLLASVGFACGKKGPPLPPLVRLPAPPDNLTAARRGSQVDLQFTVPLANSDGTKPANVERVDVYGFTGPATVTDDQLLEHGIRVGSVDVKAPRDPDETVDPGQPVEDVDPPEGTGLDQGATAHVAESLTAEALQAVDVIEDGGEIAGGAAIVGRPLLGPLLAPASRTYVAVGITTRGRRGTLSRRVAVPLAPPPAPPPSPTIDYNETAITIAWTAESGVPPAEPPPGVLPSTPLGPPPPAVSYHVYDMSPAPPPAAGGAAPAPPPAGVRLTETPIAETRFADSRMTWDAERCYAVRAVQTIGDLTIESDARPAACRMIVDTFAPAAPRGLTAVGAEGAISLIWDPSNDRDLAGYLVLRGVAPGERLEPITPAPISETTFQDTVQGDVRYVYAVQAVDRSGNESEPSNRVEEAAR